MAEGKFVSYLRVSTAAQGRSGLGLEAQRASVKNFLNGGSWNLLAEYLEIESGRKTDRVQLGKALRHADLTGATLVIAKLDRLSRNAEFLLKLQREGVKFVAVDMPDANNLTIGIMALVAQQEREAISSRTKAALQAAKARGVTLGNPNGAAHMRGLGKDASAAAVKKKADEHAKKVAEVIVDIQSEGVTSLNGIAKSLNLRGILSPRGGTWYASGVANVLKRVNL